MRSLFSALLAVFLISSVHAETIDRVVAVVNDEIITGYELEKELRLSGGRDRGEVLERLIDEALERQRIRQLGIRVAADELDAAIQDVQRQNGLTRAELEEALRAQGMSFDEYRETLRRQILRLKLVGREVQSRIEVTSKEIEDYFRNHADDFRESAVLRLSRITFPLPPRASLDRVDAVRRNAEKTLERLRAGEDFTAVLLASTPLGATGGDMGAFAEVDLTPSFARAVEGLKEGEVSDVIENAQGFHLLKIVERTPGQVRPLESVKDEITRILKERKTESQMKAWMEGLRKRAFIDVRL